MTRDEFCRAITRAGEELVAQLTDPARYHPAAVRYTGTRPASVPDATGDPYTFKIEGRPLTTDERLAIARRAESGDRSVAPRGFVRLTADQWADIVASVVAKIGVREHPTP